MHTDYNLQYGEFRPAKGLEDAPAGVNAEGSGLNPLSGPRLRMVVWSSSGRVNSYVGDDWKMCPVSVLAIQFLHECERWTNDFTKGERDRRGSGLPVLEANDYSTMQRRGQRYAKQLHAAYR